MSSSARHAAVCPQDSHVHFVTDLRPKRVTKCRRVRAVGRPRKYRTNAARQRAYRLRRKKSGQLVSWRSTTDVWETPQDFFVTLDVEFHFTLHMCAILANGKCARFFRAVDDGTQHGCWGV